jgi:hypothetical protein
LIAARRKHVWKMSSAIDKMSKLLFLFSYIWDIYVSNIWDIYVRLSVLSKN